MPPCPRMILGPGNTHSQDRTRKHLQITVLIQEGVGVSSQATELKNVVIIGGGPAGLTAALELSKHNVPAVVLEADKQVGGIARTVNYKGYLFGIGGRSLFSKRDGRNTRLQGVRGEEIMHAPQM